MKIGSIIYLKNICFRDGTIDHSFTIGRPSIFLGELEDNMYFMPLSNIKTLKHKVRIIIKPSRLNGLTKVSHPNLREVVEKPIAYYEAIGILTKEEILKVFIGIKKYYKMVTCDKDAILLTLANNYLNQSLSNTFSDKDIKGSKKIK